MVGPSPAAHHGTVERDHEIDNAGRFNFDVDGSIVEIGHKPQALYRSLGYRFQPDRLPDPCSRRVEDALRIFRPVLLTARDGFIRERVFGANDDDVVASPGETGDIG